MKILLIKLLSFISFDSAYNLFKAMLLCPKKCNVNWSNRVREDHVETTYGKINTYRYGEGKCVWLVHGWSGSAHQFWPLMQKLSEQGYRCIAIELPGHGGCTKKVVSLPKMIKAFDVISRDLFVPSHVITHGLGASVVANSKWFSSYKGNVTLVSPVFDIYYEFKCFVDKHNLPTKLLDRLERESLEREKLSLKQFDSTVIIQKFLGKLSIVYSQLDNSISVETINNIANGNKIRVKDVKQLKRDKLLSSRLLIGYINNTDKCYDVA